MSRLASEIHAHQFGPMNLHHLRQEYSRQGLDFSDLESDPFEQFRKWFKEADDAGLIEPNAMSLATASTDGSPFVRTVLLKNFSPAGFVFFTNYESRKGAQLACNPRASLLFPWLGLERQVIVSGTVEKISREESLNYFSSRPYGSRIGAWTSRQSSEVPSREFLEKKYAETKVLYPESGEVPLPETWGGYRVVPDTIEFWQGRPSRLHDRLEYFKSETGWSVRRLAP